jgi:hypothetical protein
MGIEHITWNARWISAMTLAAALAGGCSVKKVTRADSGNKQRIDQGAFVDGSMRTADEQTPRPAPIADSSSTQPPSAPIEQGDPVTLTASSPILTEPIERPIATGELELLDAKVGDINGHPIYASEFFAPIRDQLIAEADRLSMGQWQRVAARAIATRLDGIIADELLRAEAIASLSQQQRLGLRAFLQGFRSDLLSQNLGSSELANRRVLEEQGITLDEALRKQEIDTLIRLTLFREINRRVNVSWRDIKQRYERDLEKYAPPPTATFRRIRVFSTNADDVASVNEQLDSGVAFEEIAASELNTFKPAEGGIESFEIKSEFGATKFYGIDILNEKAWSLSSGEWTGPFESGPSTYWLKLEGIEQESISLYDAQLAIQREITLERRLEQQDEYLGRLIDRAHFSSRDEILLQLIDIATERFGPSE